MVQTDAAAHCLKTVQDGDEDLALSIPYAVAKDRDRLAALFAFHIELRRIPHAVSEPPLGEMRLQWWRDALDELASGKPPRAHPVVAALQAAGGVSSDERAIAERMIDARAHQLYEPRFSDLASFTEFLAGAEAPLAEMALGGNSPLAKDASRLATGYGLARFAPLMAQGVSDEASEKAEEIILNHIPALRSATPDETGRIAWLALARGYAKRPGVEPWPMRKRLGLFIAMLTGRF